MNFKALATAALATVSIATVAAPAQACYDAYSCAQERSDRRYQERRQMIEDHGRRMQDIFNPPSYDINCSGYSCTATQNPRFW